MGLFHRVLAAYDRSAGSERALQLAMRLAAAHGASLVVVSVIERIPRFAGTIGEVDETVREQSEPLAAQHSTIKRQAEEHGIADCTTHLLTGHAAQIIVALAQQERADLLVLGHRGHSDVWGRFMGSTADKIVRHAPCSVLVAR